MPHAFPAHLLLCYFHTATVADNPFITNSFIFSAGTFVVFYGTENAFAEQTIPFRLIGSVVDGFRLQNLSIRSFQNGIGRSKPDGNF